MRRSAVLFLVSFALLTGAFSSPDSASAGGPSLVIGAAEDWVRAPDLVTAKARMTLLRLAGLRAVRVTSIWAPGQSAPTPGETQVLRAVEGAAQLTGMRVFVTVYHAGSPTTPLTPEHQAEYVSYVSALAGSVPAIRDVIVGNEPNLNRFWLPQFNPDGSSASVPAYLGLLTAAYDRLKAERPDIRVWGGALSARGTDRPDGIRPTHSPTRFLQELGVAYRASGRQAPIMDGLAIHPYPVNSSLSPELPHPKSTEIGLADYDKLTALLAAAFDGTAQPGSSLPVLYAEYGVETVPPAGKQSLYTGTEPPTTKPVDERTQATYYEQAIRLAFCQPTVVGLLIFHSHDETALAGWQSGLFFADGEPKSSVAPVRDAIARSRGGSVARCAGLRLDVAPSLVRFPGPAAAARGDLSTRVRCPLDCAIEVTLRRSSGAVVRRTRTWARAETTVRVPVTRSRPRSGTYAISLTFTHPVHPGAPRTRNSRALTVG